MYNPLRKPKRSGVYCIICISNGRRYVGASWNVDGRIQKHFASLRRNAHISHIMQKDYNKYGPKNFRVEILALVSYLALTDTEYKFIKKLKPEYNSVLTPHGRKSSQYYSK